MPPGAGMGGIACLVSVLTIVKANKPRNYWSCDQLSTGGQDIMLRSSHNSGSRPFTGCESAR
jgi:hypothetical protein